MKIYSRLAAVFASLLCGMSFAFAAFDNDLSISGDDLIIQPNQGVVERDVIKLYVTVRNNGIQDLTGTVKFFVDGNQVTTDQPVSVKQGSIPDEVFVNWETTAGNHTVSAQIYPYETEGDDTSNNYVEKNLFVDSDTDGDGIGDSVDVDDDNDGVNDNDENSQGTNPKKYDTDNDGVGDGSDAFPNDSSETTDTDGDGVGDNADTDDDNDGLPDDAENTIQTNPLNPDTDGDGVENCNDLQDAFPLDSAECVDSDGDGVGDNSDAFPSDGSEWSDCDGDGIGDNADTDDDNDGYLDEVDALTCNVGEWRDCDGDGVGDNADEDDDNDGYADENDAFICDASEWKDSDNDGLGDNADPNDSNQGPIPVLEGNRIVIVNNEVVFDASGSSDADGVVMNFAWDFGDASPIHEGEIAPHVYTKVGEYLLKLTVTDDKGESRVKEAVVVVENSPWLENVLLWLMLLLLLIFLYIFWKTVVEKRKQHKQK